MLNVDREDAFKALDTGENILLSGEAGSGKTFLIKEFAKQSKLNVALTATTGMAALNLGGETIHRLIGIGIATRPEQAEPILKKWKRYKTSSKPWEKAKWKVMMSLDAIVIDEASMLRKDQFELIEVVLNALRDSSKPFGGIQMILVGDFFQLPPVVTTWDEKKYPDLNKPYCFQSSLWTHASFCSISLTTQYRQSDKDFLRVLNKIRIGKVDEEVNSIMASRVNAKLNSTIAPLKLSPFKADVRTENMKCLKKIKGPKYLSEADYTGNIVNVDILKKDCVADDKLYFCKGAQVMMITNEQKGLWHNGTMGIVTQSDPILIELSDGVIVTPEKFTWEKVNYKVTNDKWKKEVVASVTQYPFRLAWASSIHKSQGLTLDYIDLDVEKCFASGQAYVALSRVKTLEGLSLKSWNKRAVKTDPRVLAFYKP